LEQKATNFIEIISKCVNNLVVKKKVDVKKHKAWYNDGHKKLKYEMNTSYTRASIKGDEEDWNQYNVNRNLYVNKLRNDRDRNDQYLIERIKNDPKNLWKVLKKLVKQKSKQKKDIVHI
jgi:pyruvate/2-oxoacid:ferredoxin oxidoreductase beta subunit